MAYAHIKGDARLVCMAYSNTMSPLNLTWKINGVTIPNISANVITEDHFHYQSRLYFMSVFHRCNDPVPLSLADNSMFQCQVDGICSVKTTVDLVVYGKWKLLDG